LGNAENKLQEAQYFLEQMRTHSEGTIEFMYNLSAFLSASRSIMDVLLYDYGIKYGLFTINDRVYPSDFQRLAQGNSTVASFYTWWTQKRDYLAVDPIGGFLSEKRRIVVHRGRPAMAWSLILAETISFHSRVSVTPPSRPAGSSTPNAIDVTSTTSTSFGSSVASPPTVSTSRHSVIGYFADYPSDSVIDICEKYVHMLNSIVTEARTQFP